ncbi:serine protein kinase RIO [Nonomuraea sp. KM90]|uniref:serine protein kinase RIO n=1 Tax=Nonomuraea sp. KM90 TaxID=3457428 RepID=UPI003FCDCDB2
MPKHSQHRRRGKHALDADDVEWLETTAVPDTFDGPSEGDRWSTWDQSTPTEKGPRPHPDWLVTELAAVDTEHGVLKTGKEADVHLISRGVPARTGCACWPPSATASSEHRLFHRDSGYLEGRRTHDNRMNRAMANRTAFGRQAIAGQWAVAEFSALCRLWELGVPVPYPVQIVGTEILQEFIGTPDGYAAPRLAQVSDGLDSLWEQLVAAMVTLAREGLAHGDLSPYNLLVHDGRLVIIDLPQIVDVIAHPAGPSFLDRDARNVATWFAAKGHPTAAPDTLATLLRHEARLTD